MKDRPWKSWLALRLSHRATFLFLLLLMGNITSAPETTEDGVKAFARDTMQRWCQAHPRREDLQAVVVEVRFRPEPPLFTEGEGVTVAPIALDLPGAQRVVEVASRPVALRTLTVQGVTALAWEYGGRAHREMRFVGMALVERPALVRVTAPASPSFEKLPADLRPEALARAKDLEEHRLDKCAAFPEWAKRSAGAPPYTSQILGLVRAVAAQSEEAKRGSEDVCAAIRAGRFTPHWAQVAVVMAARELGIPSFGFASASGRQVHLVGTYTDQLGWILIDVERPDDGWFSGGPPLITLAPLLGGFTASRHGFWTPEGAAFSKNDWSGVSAFSSTLWRGRLAADHEPTDTTDAQAWPLSKVCK